MLKIALTGGIACGKSLAGQYLAREGVPVCDTDDVAHALLDRDPEIRAALLQEFGPSVAAPAGGIDRNALGQIVFADAGKRARLNALTHPAILKRVEGWIQAQAPDQPVVVVIIPLLYEAGLEKEWDKVICLAAPEADQLRRLAERGLSDDEARARIGAQESQAGKMEKADYVIYNCGSKALLEEQLKQVWRGFRGA